MDCQENDTCGAFLRLVLALKRNSFISDCYGHSWLLCCLCCSVFCISLGISMYWVAGSVAKAQCPNTKVPLLQKWNMCMYTGSERVSFSTARCVINVQVCDNRTKLKTKRLSF